MLEALNIAPQYAGFLFLAESARHSTGMRSHHHLELELNLVVRGTITYVLEEGRFTFGPRTLLWMFPAQEHQLVDRSGDAENYVAVFKPDLIASACHSPGYEGLRRDDIEGEGVLNTVLDVESFDLIRKTMQMLVADGLDPGETRQRADYGIGPNYRFEHNDPDGLNAGLRHLLLHCWRSQQRRQKHNRPVALHPAVRRALELLSEGEWEEDFGRLARSCGVSESYLSRIFVRQIGVSLTRYRNSIRLGKFIEHYQQPEQKTISESVYAAGFGSYAQFYKVFTQTYGCGPRSLLSDRGAALPPRLAEPEIALHQAGRP